MILKAPSMIKRLFCIILSVCFIATVQAQSDTSKKNIQVCIASDEMKLYQLIMQYRRQHGLPSIPLSTSLTYVAKVHCLDLQVNRPDLVKGCNLHSWSDKGNWSPCCYTPDHKKAEYMWSKPSELTNYKNDGFEIAFSSFDEPRTDTYKVTPEMALAGWQSSPGHNNMILNKDIWSDNTWNAIGVCIYKNFSVVWFGMAADVETVPVMCK
jgi:hypothetical protein